MPARHRVIVDIVIVKRLVDAGNFFCLSDTFCKKQRILTNFQIRIEHNVLCDLTAVKRTPAHCMCLPAVPVISSDRHNTDFLRLIALRLRSPGRAQKIQTVAISNLRTGLIQHSFEPFYALGVE